MCYHFTHVQLYITDKSIAQVAIRWLLHKDIVSSVIIGASTMAQLEANMGAATGWKLTDEEVCVPVTCTKYIQVKESSHFKRILFASYIVTEMVD